MGITITRPKFDLHGLYQERIRGAIGNGHLSDKEKMNAIKALVNQAYQQGKYDARVLQKAPKS